ncbi:MAG TPA: hypothetical protein EYO73_02860 [Sulfurimonas sp.]|nr:hypothetical protein [Sulfurimonas sp.]
MLHNKYEEIADTDYKMIEAYINKPEVTQWYVNAFKSFNLNGIDLGKWHWSWWAFFGSVFFLLYRKSYTAAAVLSGLLIIGWFIPFGWMILWILSGGYSTYFVYKTYKEKYLEIQEANLEDENKNLEMMQALGGTNEWAIVVGILAQLFFWGSAIFMIGFSLTFLGIILTVLFNVT